ncbi:MULTISPECIES: peptidase domain-containing ABC transporter [unclassified Cupriavidus]|uniref:peptidase domain-containing ABC transporter n=1 Tax=unclassified Cupriavidus TaxID=2640874 RepID=UPI00313DD46B
MTSRTITRTMFGAVKGLHPIEPVYQGETSECGLACLAMLLQSLGREVTLADLRARHGAPLLGMSLADLADALAAHGVAADPVCFPGDALRELPLPAILHVGGNHFVLAMRGGGHRMQVFDPAVGMHVMHASELASVATGYALVLDETVRPQPRTADSRRRARIDMLGLAGGARLLALMIGAGLLAFLTPLFVGMTVDWMLDRENLDLYENVALAYVLALVGVCAFDRLSARAMHRRCAGTGTHAMTHGFGQLLDNRLRYFSRRKPGDIVERLVAFGEAARDRTQLGNALLCASAISAVTVAVMAWLQPALALVSVAGMIVTGVLTQRYVMQAQVIRVEDEVSGAEQRQFLLESVQGITALKSANIQHARGIAFTRLAQRVTAAWRAGADLELRQRTAYTLVGGVELMITLGIAGRAIMAGELTFGGFYAFAFLRQMAIGAVGQIYGAWLSMRSNRVAEARAQDIFEHDKDAGAGHRGGADEPTPEVLGVQGLCMRHDGGEALLDNLSLEVRRDEKIAIIGPSGAGKTTLLTLLSGLERPGAGSVRIDGAEAADWAALRAYCYLQTAFDTLFSGSVADNITMFAARPELGTCARIADELGLAARLASLPAGLATVISEATASLSAGERQRLLVARALYARSPVRIFDEPTANLDDVSAGQVMRAITAGEGVAIVVTHDRSLLPLFDAVYELRAGALHCVHRFAHRRAG